MDKIKCEVVRDLMPLVADDVASEESKELVNEHMEGCEVCKAYFAGMTAQLARTAVPEEGPTGAFVKFTKRMEKRVRMKKVMIAMTAAFVALCVVIVGGCAVIDKMNTNVPIDIDKTQVWLWYESDGQVYVAVKMKEGFGWYNSMGWYREGDVVYLTPYEPEWKLWQKGNHGGLQKQFPLELLWEDGQLYYVFSMWEDEYNAEMDRFEGENKEYKVPIHYVRWGDYNSFTTLYEEGDVIMTREEVYELIYPSEEDEKDMATATPTPVATVKPAAKGMEKSSKADFSSR